MLHKHSIQTNGRLTIFIAFHHLNAIHTDVETPINLMKSVLFRSSKAVTSERVLVVGQSWPIVLFVSILGAIEVRLGH